LHPLRGPVFFDCLNFLICEGLVHEHEH
jgi:hypothetical protein